MNTPTRFIVIDYDSINNMVCDAVINIAVDKPEIQTFINAQKGLAYIQEEYANDNSKTSSVLFLDINMPGWDGWEFLENFEKLDGKIKKQIRIYMLSSSIDSKDMARARSNPHVTDYISKPLTPEVVSKIIG